LLVGLEGLSCTGLSPAAVFLPKKHACWACMHTVAA
jgi:hypothetical protein